MTIAGLAACPCAAQYKGRSRTRSRFLRQRRNRHFDNGAPLQYRTVQRLSGHRRSFVLQLITADVDKVVTALASDRADLVRRPLDADAYLNALQHGGLVATAAALRPMADRL